MTTSEPAQALLVTPGDILGRLGREEWDDEAAEKQARLFCVDVTALIRHRRPRIGEWLAAGQVAHATVVAVAFQIAQRAQFAAESGGVTPVGVSHPEFSVQYSQVARAGLYLDKDDLRNLTPPDLAESAGKAFSVMPNMGGQPRGY